jgi:hypothetical protein
MNYYGKQSKQVEYIKPNKGSCELLEIFCGDHRYVGLKYDLLQSVDYSPELDRIELRFPTCQVLIYGDLLHKHPENERKLYSALANRRVRRINQKAVYDSSMPCITSIEVVFFPPATAI